jgi:hypothetical protein
VTDCARTDYGRTECVRLGCRQNGYEQTRPCGHPVRGMEPVVCGSGIVRSRSVVSARAVVRAGDIAAHKSARAMAGKAVLGKSRAGQAMLGKTRAGKTVAGESPATHAVRRKPVHATAVRVETATAHAKTAARVESAAYMSAAATHPEGTGTAPHVERARATTHVHTAAATDVHATAATDVHAAAATRHRLDQTRARRRWANLKLQPPR